MKNLILYTCLCWGFLAACNAQTASSPDNDTEEGNAQGITQKKISKRNYSITRNNAYTDLFLDSAVMERFIVQNKVPDSLSRRIRSFYNARNYQFAWFSSNGLTEQARGFWNLHDYHTTYNHDTVLHDKALAKRMDAYLMQEAPRFSGSDKNVLNTELTLTEHFIQFTLNEFADGYVKRKEMERFVPQKKADAVYLADSLMNKKHKDNKYFEDVHKRYGDLKSQLAKYTELTRKGGWGPGITLTGKSLKKGTSSPTVAAIKRRLQLTGDMPGGDTSAVFNDSLVMAVKNFQVRHGFTPDGVIGANFIKALNITPQQRLQQLLMNMERMRWMPNEPSGNLIVVNIPEFVLHVYDDNKKVFDMAVVVGKEGHNTTMFTGDLNQVVFSPHWNVPPSIVKNEILPKLASNPGYLESQNMEQVGTEGGLPVIRQRPGGENALGQVKFLFPNSYNIYFHDTPAKSLFSKDKRAYSHGCIRLSDPYKMAEYLLRNQPEWTPSKIMDAMNAGTEKFVKLKKPVPVFISYYTAWVDEAGRLNFREDIYNHDRDLAQKMFGGNTQLAKR